MTIPTRIRAAMAAGLGGVMLILAASGTLAQRGRSYPFPDGPRPEGPQTYGPGSYTENGRTVWVPRNCYVSREQRLERGRLVWVPLVTCQGVDTW